MSRARRIAIYALAGFAAGLVVAALIVFLLMRSGFGQERVRVFAVKWLENRIQGKLTVGRLSGPSLLGGVTLHDVQIRDTANQPFVQVDSARIEYKWRTLLQGQIQLQSAKLYHPRVVMQQLPGDTAWNYEQIFIDRTPGVSGKRRLIEINNVDVYNGFLTIRQPLDTDGNIEVQDTARSIIESTPRGLVKVMHFDSLNARLNRVLWESPIEKGKLFDARRVTGLAYVWKDPLRIADLQGRVLTRDSLITLDIEPVKFGGSSADVVGSIVQEEGRNRVDLQIRGEPLRFQDLKWLYSDLPEEGTAVLTLRIQSQPRGTLFYASNARVNAPGSNIQGNFGIVTGDTTYFTDVDLTASPMNLELLEKILPGKLPVQGLMVGKVEVKGPISYLDTRGDIRFRPLNSSVESVVKWSGFLDATSQLTASNLRADVQNLQAVLNALRPDLKLPGAVHGRVQADGVLNERLNFVADLQHQLAGLSSRIEGGGSYDARSRKLDLKLNATPLSFEELANAYPALKRLRGEARGPINLSGPIDSLTVESRLATGGGELEFKGTLQQNGGRRRYAGEGRLSGFQLDRLLYNLPGTNVSGTVQFDLTGKSAEDADGRIAVELEQAQVQGVSLRDVRLAARTHDGVLAVDSLRAQSLLGLVTGSGDIGIAPGRKGTLALTVQSDSLLPLGSESNTPTGGELRGRGTLRGGVGNFDLDADATIARALFARASARHTSLRLSGRALGSDSATLQVMASADSADIYGEKLDSVQFTLTQRAGTGQLSFAAASAERAYRLNGDLQSDSLGLRLSVNNAAGGVHNGLWESRAPFQVRFGAAGLQADSFFFQQSGGQGNISGGGTLAWARSRADSLASARQPLDFRLSLQHAPVNDYLRFFRTNAATDGAVDARVTVTGTAGDPIIRADATFRDLRYGDTRLDYLSGSFDYAQHRIDATVLGRHNGREVLNGKGQIPVDLGFVPIKDRKLDQPLEFAMRTDSLPASLVAGLAHGFSNVAGQISGTINLRGTPRDPTIAGLLTLTNGAANYLASGVRYRDVKGTFNVLNDSLVAIDAFARAGNGTATLKGNMVFLPLGNPRFELTVDPKNFLAAQRSDVELTMSGQLQLLGRFHSPLLKGEVTVEEGLINLDELYRQTQVVALDPNRSFFNVVDTSLVSVKRVLPVATSPFIRNLQVSDMGITVGGESRLRSRALNLQVNGRLEVTLTASPNQPRTVQDITMAGELNAVRGTYLLENRVLRIRKLFQIREGTVDFPGTPGLDPNLAITTVYRARPMQGEPIDILALVSGTLMSPRIRLSSEQEPPVSESDLASYLFFGLPTSALSMAQANSLDAFNGRYLASNVAFTTTLGIFASGLQNLAQDYNLLDYVSLTAGGANQNGTQSQAVTFSSMFSDTRLEVGRYLPMLGQDIFAIYSQGLASSSDRGARLEWRFRPTYTLELLLNDDRNMRAPIGIEYTSAFRKVYGFFLFKEWSY